MNHPPAAEPWDTQPAPSETPARLVSVALPAPQLTLETFARAAHGNQRFAWRRPNSSFMLAGTGAARELFAWGAARFDELDRKLRTLFDGAAFFGDAPARPRLFGGVAFQNDFAPDDTWAAFHPTHFLLPHVQFVAEGTRNWLTLNALIPREDDVNKTRADLEEALRARLRSFEQTNLPAQPQHDNESELAYPLSRNTWRAMIRAATTAINKNVFHKVVLARVCELRCARPIDTHAALMRIAARYPDCFAFLFEPKPGHAFLAASPELLVNVAGPALETVALAGSIRRGLTEPEDEALARALLGSQKDQHEHALVRDMIFERLQPISQSMHAPTAPRVMKLRNIQHLHTPIHAQLKTSLGIIKLVEALHPTPAMGGQPREPALRFIQQAEPVTRGWYAAPVGWMDSELNGEFCVAIRSAVMQEQRAWLYAGCGIVASSDPESEWDETALKFKPMLEALT